MKSSTNSERIPLSIAKKKRGSRKDKKRGALKASMIQGTKNQMLKNIYDVVNGMLKSDLASKYEQIMGATDLEEIEEEVAETIRTKVAVRAEDITPVDVEDDVQALMANEEGLSNEFKEKASTIFEAAVHAKVVDELNTKLEEIEGEKVKEDETFQKELAQFKKDDAIQQSTKDLADTDSEKIAKLAEGIEFENTEQYIEKLNVLKESYFPKSEAVTSEITETDENIEVSEEQSPEKIDQNMKHYTSAISRYKS